MKELKRLPFDERNEQDFEDLTRNIQDAVATIKKSRSIPATQEKLAELVGCTRKTLHNRVWPINELKKIKEERKANKDSKPKNTTAEHRLSSENHIAREKLLIGRIRNLQEQNGKLFDRVQELEEQKEVLTDTAKVLEDEIVVLKDEIRKLERELRQLKQGHNGRTKVVSIIAIKKTKGAKKEKR
jgi:chromosome segregation ATPase